MSAVLFRLLVYAIIFGALYFGLRRIVRDWRDRFKQMDEEQHQRDLKERERPDVIELKQDDDGIYRPSGRDGDDRTGR